MKASFALKTLLNQIIFTQQQKKIMKKISKPGITQKGLYQKPTRYHLLLLLLVLIFTVDRATGQTTFWGLTGSGGGANYYGVIFEYDPAGAGTYTVRHDFDGENGGNPQGSLLEVGGKYYGTTPYGGSSNAGVLFEYNPAGTGTYTVKYNFVLGDYPNWGNGSNPCGSLIESGGKFYGMTTTGGSSKRAGVIFEYNPAGAGTYTVKHIFNGTTDGGHPQGSLLESGGKFYGMTTTGGNGGVIFEYDPAGVGTFTVKHTFHCTSGCQPYGSLVEFGGKFYGTTAYGGFWNRGMLFEYDPAGAGTYTVKHDFDDGMNGGNPQSDLLESGGKFYGMTNGGGSSGYNGGVLFEYNPAGAGTYTVKHEFNVTNGRNPTGSLLESGGKFYGTTFVGGSSGNGVVFEYDPAGAGTYMVLKNLGGADGANPFGGHLIAVCSTCCIPPTVTCPQDIIVNNDAGQCGANVSFTATATGTSPTITYSHAPGSFFPVGTTMVTTTATNSCGTATCSFNVTITDNEDPLISVQDFVSCFDDGDFGCAINLGATANDNCAIATFTSDAPTCFPVGTTTVTWTATDIHGNISTATQLVTRNPEINIDICAVITRTIYAGVGPQSVNLNSTVTGGTPGYSYSWSPSTGLNDATIANPIASPTVTTNYTLTVTDALGCQRSLDITIDVLPLSAAVCSGSGNNVKFSICHIPPGNPTNPQNICIAANALNAHLISGSNGHNNCYLGPCGQQLCFSTTTSNAPFTNNKQIQTIEEVAEAFKVKVYPNPGAGASNIQVISKSNEPITVRIMDMNGVVREVSSKLSKTNSISVGTNLSAGTYMAEVTQGKNKQMVKMVKLD